MRSSSARGLETSNTPSTRLDDCPSSERVYDAVVDESPRALSEDNQCIHTETTIEASYAEIYNERVRDLLVPTGRPLRVREHPTKGACVPELTVVSVRGRTDLAELLAVGSRARATAATRGNAHSSRSHAVVSLVVARRKRAGASSKIAEGWWSGLDAPSSSTSTIRLVTNGVP